MMMRSIRGLVTPGILCMFGGSVLAGPLAPPPGPIASTAKPLSEVEPRIAINATNTPGSAGELFRIVSPGSYYLESNITGQAGLDGILVLSNEVTIDLNGFRMLGVAGSGDAIKIQFGGTRGLVVKNGTLRDWDGIGIDTFNGIDAVGGLIENVTVRDCALTGISAGDRYVIRGCTVTGNGSVGVLIGNNSVVEDTVITDNGSTGLLAPQPGVRVEGVFCTLNGGDGMTLGDDATILRCSARDNFNNGVTAGLRSIIRETGSYSNNMGDGFFVDDSAVIVDCMAIENGSEGVRTFDYATLVRVTASENGVFGVSVGGAATIMQCNSNLNGGAGFVVSGSGSTIDLCNASDNSGVGFALNGGGAINACHSESNGDGFVASTRPWSLTGCVASANSGRGFWNFDDSAFRGCVAWGNTDTGFDDIITSSLENCAAYSNTNASGFTCFDSTLRGCVANGFLNGYNLIGSVMTDSVARDFLGVGVSAQFGTIVTSCRLKTSSSATDGVTCNTDGNRIESNTIDVGASGVAVNLGSLSDNTIVAKNLLIAGTPVADLALPGANKVAAPQSDITAAGPWDNIID